MMYKVWCNFLESHSDGVVMVEATNPEEAKRIILSSDVLNVVKVLGEPVEYGEV